MENVLFLSIIYDDDQRPVITRRTLNTVFDVPTACKDWFP